MAHIVHYDSRSGTTKAQVAPHAHYTYVLWVEGDGGLCGVHALAKDREDDGGLGLVPVVSAFHHLASRRSLGRSPVRETMRARGATSNFQELVEFQHLARTASPALAPLMEDGRARVVGAEGGGRCLLSSMFRRCPILGPTAPTLAGHAHGNHGVWGIKELGL